MSGRRVFFERSELDRLMGFTAAWSLPGNGVTMRSTRLSTAPFSASIAAPAKRRFFKSRSTPARAKGLIA
jgi:hypothetical protein